MALAGAARCGAHTAHALKPCALSAVYAISVVAAVQEGEEEVWMRLELHDVSLALEPPSSLFHCCSIA